MDLNPDAGQYRFSAEVPLVEANALRATLGVRPLPQPLAGALRGTLHITGPLEEPLFSGAQPSCCSHRSLRTTLQICIVLLVERVAELVCDRLRDDAAGIPLADTCLREGILQRMRPSVA
jgi:hypothetical protein